MKPFTGEMVTTILAWSGFQMRKDRFRNDYTTDVAA
jgi:hypothetical protein